LAPKSVLLFKEKRCREQTVISPWLCLAYHSPMQKTVPVVPNVPTVPVVQSLCSV
jgi:hypothetical protein